MPEWVSVRVCVCVWCVCVCVRVCMPLCLCLGGGMCACLGGVYVSSMLVELTSSWQGIATMAKRIRGRANPAC